MSGGLSISISEAVCTLPIAESLESWAGSVTVTAQKPPKRFKSACFGLAVLYLGPKKLKLVSSQSYGVLTVHWLLWLRPNPVEDFRCLEGGC